MSQSDQLRKLTADDFCRYAYTIDEKHCLSGWCEAMWKAGAVPNENALREAIVEEVSRRYPDLLVYPWGLSLFNDAPDVKLATVADVWNAAVDKLTGAAHV